jgi:hypothetical protein
MGNDHDLETLLTRIRALRMGIASRDLRYRLLEMERRLTADSARVGSDRGVSANSRRAATTRQENAA